MNRSKQAGMATKSIVVLLVGLVLGLVHFAEAQQRLRMQPRRFQPGQGVLCLISV
jgi:hypothetical protein